MSFVLPWALAGLLGIPLLILLERLRRRPRSRVWPSLLLWRGLADEVEVTRRRWEPLLLYECAAVLLLSLAAAGPAWSGSARGRVVTVLVDESPAMLARRGDGTTAAEATAREVERIARALDPADELRRIPVTGDLVAAVTALDPAFVRILATARPGVEGPGYLVVGRASEGVNTGIAAIEVAGDSLWFALATSGPQTEVNVRLGEEVRGFATGVGHTVSFAGVVEILQPDNYEGDDRVELRRIELRASHATGSPYVDAALYHAGLSARPPQGDEEAQLVVVGERGEPRFPLVRGSDCVARPGIFVGLFLGECVWREVSHCRGDPLLTFDGATIAAWADPRTLALGLPVDRDWDDQGTLAVLLEGAKRTVVRRTLGEGEALVGDAIASPRPRFVDPTGVDRPWDGSPLPEGGGRPVELPLRVPLVVLAVFVLLGYLRAIVSRS